MADNWKNSILPGPDSLNLGSLEYDDETSLEGITQKYQDLGSQIGGLTKAAADDVSTRQTKLIGNDFGGVNPMMYATYYQPAANDTQSAMRVKGTEAALEEGMERGKAAAEADLNAAKNTYNNAMDGYNSAKEAFANLKVAMTESGMLPDGTDETEAQKYGAYPTDRTKANAMDAHEYIDDQKIDWSNEQRWSDAVNKTIADRGVDTSNWSQADWDNFWANDEVGRVFEKNYVSNAIRQDMGEDAYNRFMASYDEVIKRSNAVFDYINMISDTLPELSQDLFYVGDAPIKKEIGNDDNLGNVFTRDTSANQVAEYRKDSWIDENIAEEHREDVKKFAQQQQEEFNKAWGENTSVQGMDELKAKHEAMARAYIDYISDKVINFEQETEAKPEMTTQLKELNDTLKEIYGFDTMDMAWMTTWKKQNPDEYQRYQNQLAMAYGKMDAIEVADGEKWYYTGCKDNNGYEQLPAGTPVFFAPDGALNEDGSFRSDKLKTFVDMWKDYYSADVTKISEEELTNRQTALQDAYKAYMEETSAVAMVNSLFNSPITPDVYNSVIACFEDPGTSDKTIFGEKVSDYVKEFKEYSEKDPDAALRYLYGLTNAAYSKSKSFMRYNGVAKQLTFENLDYDKDSDAGDESKFQWNQGGFKVPEFDPEDQSQAVAAFLVLTRSMEKYRAGSEQYNINPDFMRENSMTNIAKSWGSQAMGAIDFAASIVNLLTGAVAAPFNGWKNPAENGGGMSFANIVGSIFTGERNYDKTKAQKGEEINNFGDGWDNFWGAWQQGELDIQKDDKAREYAKSLVNPLLIDVYFGDKDFSDITGVADNLMLEGKNFWESPYAFGNFVVDMAGMMAINVAEGKAIGAVAEGVGAMATRAQLKLLPAITEYKAIKKGLDSVGKGASWVDNIDDPYLAAQTAKNTLNLADDVPAAMEAAKEAATTTAKTASHLDDFQTGSTGYKILSTADDYYTGAVNFADKADDFGILNRRAANALSSLDSNNLDDLVKLYGESTRKVINALDKVTDTTGLSADVQRSIRNYQAMSNQKIVLASGETVSLAEASLTVAANRIVGITTLSSATGISARELAQLPDQARSFLLRTLKGISSSDDGLVVNGSLDMFLRSMGPSDFKAMAQDFLERAVFNNTIGKTWDKFDTYRALGASGWKRSGMYALGREFLTDALTDPLRDFKRNIQVPRMDDEGNMRVQTVGEYFTSPENLLQNLAFSSGHFLIRRLWNQYGAWHWNKEAHKAYNALDATADMKSEGAMAALKRANDAANMAQQFSDRAWKAGMNYGKVVKYTEESNAMLDKAFREIFKTQGWDLEGFETGGKGKKFKTADEYIKYMTKDNMPTKEGMHALMTSLALKSMNNYVLIKHQMGFKFGEFGNLSEQNYLRIWDRMRKTINANYEKFAGNGKDTMTNMHDFYQLIKADLISANDNGELGIKIRHFDKALDSYFGNLEEGARDGLKSGMMMHPRYGYLPIASLYYDGTFDEMKASHENGAFRGLLQEGSVIEVTTANPFVERNYISLDGLIDAMLKGEKTYDIVDNNGKVLRTVTLDYDGLNPIDNMAVYSNTFNMHKYLDPLWGKNEQDFSIALQNGRAYIVGDDKLMTGKWQTELKRAKNAITGYDWVDKKTKKKMHHEGFAETIASRAVKKGLLTEKQGKELQKNWVVENKIGEKAHKRFDALNQKMKAASDAKNKALDVIQNGDLPKHAYPTVAEVFGFSKDSGADLAAEGEKIWHNGQRIAKYLVDNYTKGEITEDMGVFTIKTKVGNKLAYRDLPVDGELIAMLKDAGKNNGQITSDLVAWAAVEADVRTPYFKKTVAKDGTVAYEMAKGYQSKLMNYYNPKAEGPEGYVPEGRFYEVSTAGDKRFSPLNAKLKEGTKITVNGQELEVGGMTIEDAYQNVVKKSGKGKAPAKDSVLNIGKEESTAPKKPSDYGTAEYTNRTHTKEDFVYERYVQQQRLDDLQKTYNEWESNNWKKPLSGGDVRVKNEETKLSDLDRLNTEMATAKEQITKLNEQIGPEETATKGVFTKNDELPLKKIISGGQTGVDQMGLEIGQRLGYETGGTAAPEFLTEKGKNAKALQKYGMTEISKKLQGGKKGKEVYLPRTEQNVINSDGTVYFASDADSAGKIATEHYAKQHGKPFILNPTEDKLKQWIVDNNIETLNVAGNRGSKLGGLSSSVEDTLINALSKEGGSNKVGLENETYKKGYKPLWDAWAKQNPELIDELAVNSAGRVLNDKFATTNVSQARALTDILLESGKKDARDLEATSVHESNKDIARNVTGDLNGMMEFGKRRFEDPKTKKVVEVGAESFDAAKLFGTEYRLARNDSGEIVVRSSEAKMAELEHAFTIQMYAALGVDYDQKAKMYKPDAFQQRYVESVIDRAKTELSDRGSFNGADFRDKLDEINSDRSLAKKWDEPIYTYKSGNRDVPVDCASFTKGLEKDNVVDAFRTYAQNLGVRARAGEFDSKLPDDVSADELARVATSVKALYDSAEYYGNRPKRMQELTEKVDEEGNVMEDQNAPTTRFVNDYGEIIDSNGFGEVIDELPLGGRMALDLSRKDLTQAIEDYQTFIKWYTKPDDPMYKIVHSKDLEKIHTARKTAVGNINDFANKLNDEAAKLYNRKKNVNKEFNAMVDSAKMNAESRMEANPKANANNLKFFYIEALGVAAPESELNSIGSGKYGQTARRYYAAKAEQANGTPNTSVDTKGWSMELTDARVQAGESYAAHLRQIATGFERLQEMSGKSYQSTIDKINMIADNLPKELTTGRADFSDNAENSIMAMLGELYDDARAERVITSDEIKFAQRKASETVLRISDKIFGLDDVNSIKDPTNFASPYGEALAAILDAHDRLTKTRELLAAIDVNKKVVDAEGKPVNAKEELQQRLIDDKNYYDDVIGTLWEKLGGDQDLGTFMKKVDNNIESIRTASDYYKDAYNNRPVAEGFGTNVPYSKQRGKESMFYKPQLAMQAGTIRGGYVADAVEFDMKTPKGMRTVEVEVDYGTGQDISETGAGARFMNTTTQTEVDYTRFSEKEADIFFGAASEAMDDSSHGLAIVKNPTSDEEVLQTYTHGWCLVSRNQDPYEFTREQFSRGTKTYSPDEVAEKAIADYAEKTKDYKPQEEIEKAQKEIDKAAKEYDSNKKKADTEKAKVKKQSRSLDDMAKKVLNEEEYARYKAARERLDAVKDADPTKGGIYRPDDGSFTIISKKNHKLPSGTTTVKTLLEGLGYDSKKFNSDISEGRVYTEAEIKADRKARKAMMKEVNENLRSGNVKKTRVQRYKNPSALDLKSQTMTINNILAFVSQCADRAKIDKAKLDPSQIVVAKDYADLLYRISREGIGPDTFKQKAKGFAMHVTEWNKFIQNVQLAGGASYINALTIAQARGAIFSSPSMTWQYIKLVTDFKDDAAVQRFAVENSARLVDIGMKVQDHTVFTDLQAAISETPGLSDGGGVASFADRVHTAFKNRKAAERTRAEKYEFATKAIQDSTDSLFGDATFKRVLPVLRAKMLMANYDSAVRLIKNKFPNIDADSLDDAACKFAYARTTAFFEPNKTTSGLFKSRRIDQALNTIYDENLRRTCAAWTGAKDDVSLGQMATNCFFALSYKNRMIQPLVQGMRSLLSPDENMQRFSYWGKEFVTDSTTDFSLSGNGMMNNLGTQFMQRGNRNMIGMVAAISAIAFISAKSLGLATSWDDLSFTDEDDLDENGNPTFKVPEILKKFQTIGQIWLPNAWDENGNPYVDPRKPQFTIDSFSSMFTLPNTAWKTVDRTFNSNDYYTAPQRGVGLLGQMTGMNPQGLNDFLNTPLLRAVGDELVGSNLLSPYKAMYEVLMDSSYYGNNIWEKRYLRDGSENPNYDPLRNVQASFMHILGLDEVLDKRGYNRWVKGYYTNDYVDQDQVGTITGSGILQHEYFTMFKQFINGQMIEGIVEGGEIPIKKRTLSSTARTEFNTKVKNIIAQYMKQYRDVADNTTDADAKDEAYAKAVKQSADAVAAWSKKYNYVLGRDQKLVPYATRSMMAMLAGEYDDNLDYIQNTYWKASAIAQIEATGPDGFWLGDEDFDAWAESGKTAEEFAAEKNKRHDAYNKALDDEYKARKALHDAGIDNEYLAGMSVQNLKAEQRAVNKEVYTGALRTMESPVGEFKNFKEMKSYYESQIAAASTTKQKAKLANQYNKYVTDALAPYVSKYGAGIIADGYYNHDYLSNALAEYIIIPADKYYTGKTPRASYLKDLFGVGYRDKSNLPSDDEVIEGYAQARKQMVEGYSASSAAILDRVIDAIKRGRLYVSDSDYSKIVRMRALLNARSK